LTTAIKNSTGEVSNLVKNDTLTKEFDELSPQEVFDIYKKYKPEVLDKYNFEYKNGFVYATPKEGMVKNVFNNKKGISPVGSQNLTLSKEIATFADLIDKINNYDPATLSELGLTKEEAQLFFDAANPIKIGSTLRSLNENIGAYKLGMSKLTDSEHTVGGAMDIITRVAPRPTPETIQLLKDTQSGKVDITKLDAATQKKLQNAEIALNADKDGDGYYDEDLPALKLEAFLNTEAGKKFLKKSGLTVYVHAGPGGGWRHLHIDPLNRPGGIYYEDNGSGGKLFTPYQLKKENKSGFFR